MNDFMVLMNSVVHLLLDRVNGNFPHLSTNMTGTLQPFSNSHPSLFPSSHSLSLWQSLFYMWAVDLPTQDITIEVEPNKMWPIVTGIFHSMISPKVMLTVGCISKFFISLFLFQSQYSIAWICLIGLQTSQLMIYSNNEVWAFIIKFECEHMLLFLLGTEVLSHVVTEHPTF